MKKLTLEEQWLGRIRLLGAASKPRGERQRCQQDQLRRRRLWRPRCA
jgi:hypothetical protein